MSTRTQNNRRRVAAPELEEESFETILEQTELDNPVDLEEEPISIEQPAEEADDADEAEEAELEDDETPMDLDAMIAESELDVDEPVAAPEPVKAAPSAVNNRRRAAPAEEEVVAEDPKPVEVTPAPVAKMTATRRRVAPVVEDDVLQDEPSAAPSAATPKSNVSGGKFAALKGRSQPSQVVVAPKPSATSKFAALKGAKASVPKSIFELFTERASEEGPVTVLNELLPTPKAVKTLKEAEYVKIRDTLCWIAGMCPIPHKSELVEADEVSYHSLVIPASVGGNPSHIKIQGAADCCAVIDGVEVDITPGIPCEFPGFDNEIISPDAFEVFTFKIQKVMEEHDVVPIIRLIDDFVADRIF